MNLEGQFGLKRMGKSVARKEHVVVSQQLHSDGVAAAR